MKSQKKFASITRLERFKTEEIFIEANARLSRSIFEYAVFHNAQIV